jgi:5-methylthioadenosine/S-adenosylhomocysteine deaminase
VAERRIIRGASVLALDGRRSVRKNDLLIEDGKIAATGGVDSVEGLLTDVRGMVMPGLVQAHLHLTDSLLDSGFVASADPRVVERIQIPAWRAAIGEEAVKLSTSSGIARALAAGVTAFADASVIHRSAALERARAYGVRFLLCVDGRHPDLERELEVQAQLALVEQVRVGIALDASAASLGTIRRVARASDATGAPILARCGGLSGARKAVRKLRRGGALGPRTLLHSARDLDLAAARAIGEARATLALSPGHDLLIGAPPPPIDLLLDARVRVAIGSGGNASRLGFDPFAEARLLLRFLEGKIEAPATYALDAIGPNGALGLGMAGGMIEAGKAADLVLLDMEADPQQTYEQTARRVIDQGGPSVVRAVWVAGNVVASDGKPRLADAPAEEEEDQVRAMLLAQVKAEEDRRQVRRAIGSATRALWRARGWRI